MSRKYKFTNQDKLYFVSFAVVYWIDLFIRREYKDILVSSLAYCIKEKGLELYGWCIMTSHVHLIIGTTGYPMQEILRDYKRHTSETLHKAIKENKGESRREWLLWMMQRAGKAQVPICTNAKLHTCARKGEAVIFQCHSFTNALDFGGKLKSYKP